MLLLSLTFRSVRAWNLHHPPVTSGELQASYLPIRHFAIGKLINIALAGGTKGSSMNEI